MKQIYLKAIAMVCMVMGSLGAWAQDAEWNTVWHTDFSSQPTGLGFSIQEGTAGIEDGVLLFKHGGSGGRSVSTTFTDSKFAVTETNWRMEFDWGAQGSSKDASNVSFATNKGNVFTITWETENITTATIKDANGSQLTTAIPINTFRESITNFSHFIVTGDKDNGIYLTVTSNGVTYVDNVLLSSTFGYPTTFNGMLGRNYSGMALDNIDFKVPAVAGFVAAPEINITAVVMTSRKFTLSCGTAGATIYYSETDLAIDATGWIEYKGETTTSATTIYAYAKDGNNTSDKVSFETGAGEAITLNAPTFSATSYANNQYIIELSANQAGVVLEPKATISYRIGEDGEFSNYSSPIAVDEGKTIYAYATFEGYKNSSIVSHATEARPIGTTAWTQDYTNIVTEGNGAQAVILNETADFMVEDISFYNIIGYNIDNTQKNVNLNTNVGINTSAYFYLRNSNPNSGILKNSNSGGSAGYLGIQNLKKGDVIFIITNGNILTPVSGLILNEGMCTTNEYYYTATATEASLAITAGVYNYIKNITVISSSVSATIGATGYTTLASPVALDLDALPEGVTAYYAESANDKYVSLAEATGKVKAGTGLILAGKANTYEIPVADEGEEIEGNLLVGCVEETEVEKAANRYVLVANGTEAEFQSLAENGATIPAGKAYLEVEDGTANGAKLYISFGEGDATAIEGVEAAAAADGIIYNIAGQRVANPTKGIYIVNGKKVLVK